MSDFRFRFALREEIRVVENGLYLPGDLARTFLPISEIEIQFVTLRETS